MIKIFSTINNELAEHNIAQMLLENLYTILILGSCLIIGLIVTNVLKLNLRVFQGVYFFLGAVFILVNYFFDFSIIPVIIGLVVGEVIMILTLGILGSKLSPKNYASILFAIGLFPWYLGINISIFYIVSIVLITPIYAHLKNIRGFKVINKEVSDPIKAVSKMNKEDLKKFKEKAAANFSIPFLISAVFSFMFFVFS